MSRESELKLTPDDLSEEQEQFDVLDKCDRHASDYPELKWLYHVPNGGYRGWRAGVKMKRSGVKRGVPDLQLDIAKGGYHGLRIEMKTADAVPSDVSEDQRDWHKFLREQGYCIAVCRGCTGAWAILRWYISLLPTRVVEDPTVDPPPVPLVLEPRRKSASSDKSDTVRKKAA